ncbi:Mpo1 family 2-hydroxy fatty acid dioxygenase [Paraliomyxa miuraensis]|uniref:Mpo1 family 2-hydroxy fatty acid dioxygenase n=1 Tax=Paraliomyxa miuraensis TaxID=376150 RepID=UPI002254D07A|nr:Mpo1-like protein [Paraliomyxa miuraensis]MCX4243058.1 DUF962 domain-containing protein [Paraliomyxa miuraensis]
MKTPPKTADQWFQQYGHSHRNPLNKAIHWVCIPFIVISLLGMLMAIPVRLGSPWLNPASILLALALVWYATVSVRLALGMLLLGSAMLAAAFALQALPVPLWASSLAIFVLAWIGQFIGHQIEGKKPSFFEDLQFLLVGPLWLLGFVYRRLGIAY